MTLFLLGIIGTAVSLGWELWMLPVLTFGTVLSWEFHIRKRMTEHRRLVFYMIVLWMLLVYHGVHATSFQDLASLAAIEFALLALTGEKRLLQTGFALFWFCFFWSGYVLLSSPEFEMDSLFVSRVIGNLGVVITTFVVALHIIRKRSQEREEDRQAIEELSVIRHQTEDFLVNISHTFRTPVNVVRGISDVLCDRETDEETREEAEQLLLAGETLSAQVNDLLDYTELSTGRFVTVKEPYMIASVLNDVIASLRLYTEERGVQVVIDADADIPQALTGDPRRIRKILYHLTDNALKYTKKGGVFVRVYAVKQDYGINLCMEVSDTGIGMTEEELAAVRRGVYQADISRRGVSGGFGLGLQIVFGMAHAMGGFARIESTPGKGTRVHVSLPQEVRDYGRCMEIRAPERLKIAFYQQPAKFDVPALRDYYTQMILHVVTAFDLKVERSTTLPDLKEMMGRENFTHLFVADEEYAEDPAYFDTLAGQLQLVVVARRGFAPAPGSPVRILQKPLYAFPLVEALNAETADGAGERQRTETQIRFDGVRALVVDDELLNLIVAKKILESAGFSVETALSGADAVEKARKKDYRVIFMDHMMPVMDGVECAHRIRNLLRSGGRQTLIVALTANAASGAREMFAKEGFDGFVAKPIERGELLRVLKRLLLREGGDPLAQEAFSGTKAVRENILPEKAASDLPEPAPSEGEKEDGTVRAEEQQALYRLSDLTVSGDSACDLPKAWIERLGIAVIPHTLHTDSGSFTDGEEINGDELMFYMRNEQHGAKSEVPDAVAFTSFFTKELERTKEVLHVSIADASSPVYNEAVKAASKLPGVYVADSGSMSGGAGMVLLYAAQTAVREKVSAEELLRRVLRFKKQMVARFILEGTDFLVRGGRMRPVLSRWMEAFLIRPTINMKNDRMKFSVSVGQEHRVRFIRKVLSKRGNIDTSLLFITHAGLTDDELEQVREETEKYVRFDRVVTMPTSSAVAINVGPGTFGLMFHLLGNDKETGGRVFETLP
ncbi:MAG: DegV family EDD domain-containing protein [Lachnospiraceae bacterium]|nr:DegV family EDD domain-containing protein [Lachnospiraceae bacterium]